MNCFPKAPGSAAEQAGTPAADGHRFGTWFRRSEAMGFWKAPQAGTTGEPVCALDLFPWWLLSITHPFFHQREALKLGNWLVQWMKGFGAQGDDTTDGIYSATVPLGSREEVGQCLVDSLREVESLHVLGDQVRLGVLLALAHLRKTGHTDDRERFRQAAEELLVRHKDGEAARALGMIAVREGWTDLSEVLAMAWPVCAHPCVALELPGILLCLGEAGRAAAAGLADPEEKRLRDPWAAARHAVETGDLDALDPFLNDSDWSIRQAAANLLGYLARAGVAPEATLEALLARCREEDDDDVRSTISTAVAGALRQLGSVGAEKVLATIQELGGRGSSPALVDALVLAGPGVALPEQVEALRPAKKRRLSSDTAYNRFLQTANGMPGSLFDWLLPDWMVFRQWNGASVEPPTVAGWFAARPQGDPAPALRTLMIDPLMKGARALVPAMLLDQPQLIPILETWLVFALNTREKDLWRHLAAILAGSVHPVSIHPAELRCAFDLRSGAFPAMDWAATGRLLEVAAAQFEPASAVAAIFLAQQGPGIQELAAHALTTRPVGKVEPSEAIPPTCSKTGKRPAVLGLERGPRFRPPSSLAPRLQLLFGQRPREEWTDEQRLLEAVEISAGMQTDALEAIVIRHPLDGLGRLLAAQPVDRIRRAALASHMCHDDDLHPVADRLLVATGEERLREDSLAPILLFLLARAKERLAAASSDAPANPTPTPADASAQQAPGSDSDTVGLEELLGDLTDDDDF